jgi:peptidyl-prolyl cis-trans isomerase B (cyclophilin B)
MILTSLLLALAPTAQVEASCRAPSFWLEGAPYSVTLENDAPAGGSLEAWALSPAAFELGGQPLAERAEAPPMTLAPGTKITASLDLAPFLAQRMGGAAGPVELRWNVRANQGDPIAVKHARTAPQGLDFMELPVEELGDYMVQLRTNRGDMLVEFWPDVAPDHVRNFLDLSYTGFYDGTTFHRVIPGFMIQGGDPTGTGTGSGKRMLKAEFSQKKHVPGVLSMARSASPDSASCQFFVMHGESQHLDGSYSAFGKLVEGFDVVDSIAKTPRDARDKPSTPQVIQKATVLSRKGG